MCTEVLGKVCKRQLQHHEYSLYKGSHKDNSGRAIFLQNENVSTGQDGEKQVQYSTK